MEQQRATLMLLSSCSCSLAPPADAEVSSKGDTLTHVQAAATATGRMTVGANCSSSGVRLRGRSAARLFKVSASVPVGVSR
jgi:hypothetical protein